MQKDRIASSGTNIDAVKRQNDRSGMTYNEVKQLLASTTGGHGTNKYSDTNVDQVKQDIQQSQQNKHT
ncbi:gamma-type small acid-soluble spore protein [Bacillus solimangrovi]|uniref:gamma-type small acid-soluble spore protein n=1 Tax=Bacillus solimangrovi TaxID=1305675 RepID=UPI00267841D7